ncbi:MAG: hypothetical protein KAW12_22555 [Candidatus Aminicenantes bacterium]|nr:hypothetical protein [Candidatus Aminicenantes bacterium]
MEILLEINFYKLVVSIFIPLLVFLPIFLPLNKKNKKRAVQRNDLKLTFDKERRIDSFLLCK